MRRIIPITSVAGTRVSFASDDVGAGVLVRFCVEEASYLLREQSNRHDRADHVGAR
jgi:hypothetical protein